MLLSDSPPDTRRYAILRFAHDLPVRVLAKVLEKLPPDTTLDGLCDMDSAFCKREYVLRLCSHQGLYYVPEGSTITELNPVYSYEYDAAKVEYPK